MHLFLKTFTPLKIIFTIFVAVLFFATVLFVKPTYAEETSLNNRAVILQQLQERVAALENQVRRVRANSVPTYTIGGNGPSRFQTSTNVDNTQTSSVEESVISPERKTFSSNMGVGARGERVTALQKCLVDLNLFNVTDMAPVYGPRTSAAVKLFQQKNGIANSGNAWTTGYGYVGPKTRNTLNNVCPIFSNGSNDSKGVNDVVADDGNKSVVDLKFEIYGDDAGYYDKLPRKVVANRKTTIKWETKNVDNCKLTLAYDNDRIYKTIKTNKGSMRIDKVKRWDKLGLDYVQLACDDEDDKKIKDRIDVEFYDDEKDARVYINQDLTKEYSGVTREEALSRCLGYALTSTNQKKDVGCVFDDKIIYQHGDDSFPRSLIRVVDEDVSVYDDGEDSEADEGEEDVE